MVPSLFSRGLRAPGPPSRRPSRRPSRALKAAVVALVAAAATSIPACDDHDHGTASGADALFQGSATDEGLVALEAQAPTEDATRAPALTTPASGSTVPAATPVTFEWKAQLSSAPRRAPGRPAPYVVPLPLGPIRAAHAHGDPMNGKGYLLTLKANGQKVVRVFTTSTTYAPDAAAWDKLKSGGTISATVTTASFDQNRLVPGSGPFASPATTFTIAP